MFHVLSRTVSASEEWAKLILYIFVLLFHRQALQISPFTLDDFINALHHDTLDPRCILLGEIHSVLTNNIAAESHGLPANLKASVDSIPLLAATVENTDGMSVAKREMWVNAALDYSRGWDRKARPRAADGRKGWERHLLGILTQKGGLEAVPSLPTIFKHLFTDEDYVSEPEEDLPENQEEEEKKVGIDSNGNEDADMKEDEEEAKDEGASPKAIKQSSPASSVKRESSVSSEVDQEAAKSEPVAETKDELAEDEDDDEEEDQIELDSSDADPATTGNSSSSLFKKRIKKPRFAGSDHPDPELRYLSLSLEHKLDILSFLCQINLQSKVVKAFIDDCETRLTEERKEKAEINKEKKELLAEKNALIKPKVKTEGPDAASLAADASNGDAALVNGNGAAPSVAATLLSAPLRSDIDPSSSAAPSEAGDSAMPDEPPSRQPSSSPLPELDDSSSIHSMTAKDEVVIAEDEAEQTDLRSDMPDDTSEPADAEEEKDEMEEDEDEAEVEIEDNKSADGGDEQDELDVGSDVDELQSSVDENEEQAKAETSVVQKPKGPGKGWRKGKGAGGAGGKKGSKTSVDRKTEIEQELEMNAKKDDLFERDWRRFREVARVRPLGKDRFYQRVGLFLPLRLLYPYPSFA